MNGWERFREKIPSTMLLSILIALTGLFGGMLLIIPAPVAGAMLVGGFAAMVFLLFVLIIGGT